jgi:hypothetical protein
MGMYVPDEVLCAAATEKANKAKEGERAVPILSDGRATTVYYVPLIGHDDAEACANVCRRHRFGQERGDVLRHDEREWNGSVFRHLGNSCVAIPKSTSVLLETIARLNFEWNGCHV